MYIDLIESQEKRTEPISAEIALIGASPASDHLLEQIIKTLNIPKIRVS